MAINVQHGNISSALGLALTSGQAIRQQQQQKQDMQFQSLVANMQADADRSHANEVSNALGVDKFNATTALNQQQDSANNQLRQQQIAQQAASEQARIQQSGQQFQQAHANDAADQQMQVDKAMRDAQAATAKQAAISQLSPREQNVVNATGNMPFVPREGDANATTAKLLEGEARRLQAEIQNFQAAALKGQSPLDKIANKPLPQVPPELLQRKQDIESLLGTSIDSVVNGAKIAQQAVQARNTAPAPAAPSAGGVPTVNTMAEYVALPSGTTYIDAQDGKTYVKR